ncbi:MAG: hypothetical protein BWY80_00525 [Firmicutes bacterium ADurb.Bin456]|nr:MAG: hypothetical protein BWY80_00525 [Firmicutes bacterium ADurb.Bin456]
MRCKSFPGVARLVRDTWNTPPGNVNLPVVAAGGSKEGDIALVRDYGAARSCRAGIRCWGAFASKDDNPVDARGAPRGSSGSPVAEIAGAADLAARAHNLKAILTPGGPGDTGLLTTAATPPDNWCGYLPPYC